MKFKNLQLQKAIIRGFISILLMSVVSVCTSSRANVYFVSNSTDTTNVASLRGAIIAANVNGGANTIVLTNSLYSLTIPGTDEDACLTGDLDVTNGDLTILGLADSNVTITAVGLGDRVLQISPNAQLTLLNLVITGGAAPGNEYGTLNGGESGGAIYNLGTLSLENCVITNNSSGDGNLPLGNGGGTDAGDGGGIYSSGSLSMVDCSITGNISGEGMDGSSGGNGGGIFNSGSCLLNNCLICNNSGGAGGEPEGNAIGFAGNGGNGGGVFNLGEITLNNSTVCSNFCGNGGNPATVEPMAYGNSGGAGGNGGGIFSGDILTLNGCTINDNSCGEGGNGSPARFGGGGGLGGSGAGIYSTGTLTLTTCTLTENACGNGGNAGAGESTQQYAGMGALGGNGGTAGAILNGGTMTLLASTVSRNSGGTGGIGGNGEAAFPAIYLITTNGTLIPIYVAGDGFGGTGGNGGAGGILTASPDASMATIHDVIIALNLPGAGGAGGQTQTTNGVVMPVALGPSSSPDLAGGFTSGGYNLIGQADDYSGFTNGVNGDRVGSTGFPLNPMLGALANNGGFTATINLLPGSPAIDAGDDTVLNPPDNLTIDQRGEPRKSGAHVDIGAVEYDGTLNGAVLPPLLTDSTKTDSGLQFWFNGAPGTNYSVWASTNLANWVDLGSASETTRGWFQYQDSAAINNSHRFYQVRYP